MIKRDRHQRYDTRTDNRRGAVRRRLIAWLGLLLIAVNMLGGAALPVPAEASPLSLAQAHDRIEICTSAGMVVMDLDGTVRPSSPDALAVGICPFCLPLSHSAAIATEAASLVVSPPQPVAAGDLPATLAPFRRAAYSRAAAPRAPPLS